MAARNTERSIMLTKQRRSHHSSRVKLPFCQQVSELVLGVNICFRFLEVQIITVGVLVSGYDEVPCTLLSFFVEIRKFLVLLCRNTSLLVLSSKISSSCHTWELNAASWLGSLATGLPVLFQSSWHGALSISGHFDAIGLCTVENLSQLARCSKLSWNGWW